MVVIIAVTLQGDDALRAFARFSFQRNFRWIQKDDQKSRKSSQDRYYTGIACEDAITGASTTALDFATGWTSFDLVELYPPADVDGLSALTASRLLLNAIGAVVRQDEGADL